MILKSCKLCNKIIKCNELYECIKCKDPFDYKCKYNYLKNYTDDCPFCFIPIMNIFTKIINVYLKPTIYLDDFLINLKYIDNKYNDIEVRCLKLDSRTHHELIYPDKFKLVINNKEFKRLDPLEKNISIKIRKDISMILNYKLFISNDSNLLKFSINNIIDNKNTLKNDPKPIYIFMICSVSKLKNDIILENSKRLKKFESLTHIKNFFKNIEIIEKISLNLKCKLTLSTTNFPARGKHCDHINFFCMKSHLIFLSNNARKKFFCPLCNKPLYEYVIDDLLLNLIKEYKKYNNIKIDRELQIFSDKDIFLGGLDNNGTLIKKWENKDSISNTNISDLDISLFDEFENDEEDENHIIISSESEEIKENNDKDENSRIKNLIDNHQIQTNNNYRNLNKPLKSIEKYKIDIEENNLLNNFKLYQISKINAKILNLKKLYNN